VACIAAPPEDDRLGVAAVAEATPSNDPAMSTDAPALRAIREMSRYDKPTPSLSAPTGLAVGLALKECATPERPAIRPPEPGRLQWVPRSPAPWRPETRLGFYVRAAAYNTRGTNVFT